jgi:outer membrane protein
MNLTQLLFDEMRLIDQPSRVMRVTALLLVFAGALTVSAQTNGMQIRKLSLDECVTIALQHNFDVQITRYDPIGARYTLAGVYGAYDPLFTSSFEHSYDLSPGGLDDEGRPFGSTETKGDAFGGGFQGFLPWGLNYNLGGSMSERYGTRDTLLTNTVPSLFDTTSGSVGALSLSQPLLRNFWVDATRYNIYSAKQNVSSQEGNFRDQVMLMLLNVETAYYRLVSLEDGVKVQEKALELAERLLAENKKRVEVGALAPLDEQQAQAQAATTRAALIQAEAARDTAQRDLKNLLSDNYTNAWADVWIEPTDRLLAIPRIYNLQESWRDGLADGPGLLQGRSGLDVAKYNVRFRRNQLFPQVDVTGSYGYSGSGREFSDALGTIGDRSFPFWSVGGVVSVPLSRTAERNSYKLAKSSKEQQELRVKQLEQQLLVEIENDITEAKALFEQVDATRQARLYAEAALEAEQKKLENGKSTTFVVLQLQRDLTTARANEIIALGNYNVGLATLAYHEGSILDRRKVDLDIQTLETRPVSPYKLWEPSKK